jgi:SAM-dependent methyltransferase
VVDSVWYNLLALGQIKEKQGLQNLHLAYVDGQLLPFPAGAFDLVTFDQLGQGQDPSLFTEAARAVFGLLKPGGTAQFTLGNKWVRQRLFQHHRTLRSGLLSLSGYERALLNEGFENPQVFIPLPDHRIPLYFLPITSPEATRYLFRALLPLIDTISPEIKAANRLRYLLVRLAAPFAKRLPTNWALKLLAPSYIAIARR